MQFAMYLVDNGVLTCEEYYEASKLQMHSRPQLGALAIEARRLTVKQVFAVLSMQCDEPNTKFGELAVRLGYLTDDDITQLLAEQERRAMPLLDVLVENDFLSAQVAEQHYAEYRRCLQAGPQELTTVGA
ncbi:MAG: hypothetical protein H0T51_16055 [Pirellulales bacterium]|nr:hypothetical protein [Pirellulales bacterium]